MSDAPNQASQDSDFGLKLLYVLTVSMVVVGMFNATPGIPGYDEVFASVVGVEGAQLRKFPFEWFYPAFFALMMLIVALKHSMWRDWEEHSPTKRRLGLALDIALVAMALDFFLKN